MLLTRPEQTCSATANPSHSRRQSEIKNTFSRFWLCPRRATLWEAVCVIHQKLHVHITKRVWLCSPGLTTQEREVYALCLCSSVYCGIFAESCPLLSDPVRFEEFDLNPSVSIVRFTQSYITIQMIKML